MGEAKTGSTSDSVGSVNAEMLQVLKDIYRITGMTSRASHAEQTEVFRRMRAVIAKAESC